jgi:O-antigen/teichoic acid export membrane protein
MAADVEPSGRSRRYDPPGCPPDVEGSSTNNPSEAIVADTTTDTGTGGDVHGVPRLEGLRERTSRGVAWTLLQAMGSRLLSATVFIVLARLLPPDAFGVVALASVFVALFQLLTYGGYNQALVQLQDADKKDYDTVFWTGLWIGGGLTAGLFAAAPYVGEVVGEPTLSPVLQVMSLAVLIAALGSGHQAVLQREMRFGSLAVRRMLASVASSVVGLGMALAGYGVWALVGQTIALSVGGTATLWIASGYRPGLGFSLARLRRILKISSYMLGSRLLQFATQRSDDLLIGAVLGARALGFYSVAYRLLTLLLDVLATSVQTVAFATLSRLQNERQRLRLAFSRMTRLAATVAVPVFFIVGVTAPELVSVIFGDAWLSSVPVMRILAVYGALQVTLQLNGSLLNSIGQASTALGIHVLNAVTTLLAIAGAVPFGIVWVAIAVTVRAYLLAPVSVLAVCRHTGMKSTVFIRSLLPPFLSATVMAGSCLVVQPHLDDFSAVSKLAILIVLGGTIYVLLLWAFARSYLVDLVHVARDMVRRPGRRPQVSM